MKADNVTSLDKGMEASEASKFAQGHSLGPPFRSVTPPSFGEMVERVGCVGQFPPSCHVEVKPGMQSMALLWQREASSFWDEKYSPGLPDFLGSYYSRSLPGISATSRMHFQISGANIFIEYSFDVSYYEFFIPGILEHISYIEHNGVSASSQIPQLLLLLFRGNPDRTRGGASCKERPQVAGNKGLCTVGTAVFRPENRGSIDQIGVNGEWNRHSEEQRWYWGETQGSSCS